MRTCSISRRPRHVRRGTSLLELTVMILVLLTLATVLFIGAGAWKRGSDRAQCIAQIRSVQVAVRSYANMSGLPAGRDLSRLSVPISLKDELIGRGRYVESTPSCPGGGEYSYGGDVIPEFGDLYLSCSLGGSQSHVPDVHSDW